ncbi:pentatricopeptide repeat-containing protein At3g58590-like [Durio zibethinus]|uniref:Pentatricopeptide repeat-containing protein At3g58590-like n=1 Tax=Durio zibethinus TaxID=66656 RepID=A0A6P6A7U8_DURZI|nr:pentatricopeptide repeat-containing protein At3g58590-like [Durio zibethinus]
MNQHPQQRLLQLLKSTSAFPSLKTTKRLHAIAITLGPYASQPIFLYNNIISQYASLGHLSVARKVFDSMTSRNVVSFSSIITAYSKSGDLCTALELFSLMRGSGFWPSPFALAGLLSSQSLDLSGGVQLQALVVKNGLFYADHFVGTALLGLYGRYGFVSEAVDAFEHMSRKSLVTWNSIISLCAHHGLVEDSMLLFRELLRVEASLSDCSFVGVLSGLKDFERPLALVPSNIAAGIYNRVGQHHETIKLLSVLEEPDIVSWNIVIAACARNGHYKDVFELFRHMQMTQIYPDNYTFVSLLTVCSKLCDLALGSSVHGLIIKTDFSLCDTFVCNVLIDMYGKCGCLKSSVKIFNGMANRNLITWTCLISALGVNGYYHEALDRFQEMEFLGFRPDVVTLISILTVCRHAGLVKEGMELFRRIKSDYGFEPKMDHYYCVVDLLARHGKLKEAEQIIASMPFPPDALTWRSFLEGCKRHRSVEDLSTGHGVVKLA